MGLNDRLLGAAIASAAVSVIRVGVVDPGTSIAATHHMLLSLDVHDQSKLMVVAEPLILVVADA